MDDVIPLAIDLRLPVAGDAMGTEILPKSEHLDRSIDATNDNGKRLLDDAKLLFDWTVSVPPSRLQFSRKRNSPRRSCCGSSPTAPYHGFPRYSAPWRGISASTCSRL